MVAMMVSLYVPRLGTLCTGTMPNPVNSVLSQCQYHQRLLCRPRLGTKVLLAEATGCLGGMGTSGLISTFGPVPDGKRVLVGDFMKEPVESMHQSGNLGPHVVASGAKASLTHCLPYPARPHLGFRVRRKPVQRRGSSVSRCQAYWTGFVVPPSPRLRRPTLPPAYHILH